MRMGALADVRSGKRDSEKGQRRAGEALGETTCTGRISTDETR